MLLALLLFVSQYVTIPNSPPTTTFTLSSQTFSFQIPIPSGCVATTTAILVTITCTTTPPPPPLTITTPVILPTATVGKVYTASLATLAAPQGGVAPYKYSAIGLPPGLTLSSTGTLSGTPTLPGSYTISFTVTDSSGVSTNATIILASACPPPIICT